MASVWIVHRDPRQRAALARLARIGTEGLAAAPGDPVFAEAAVPRVVVLGLAGDFEGELEFAHRMASRLPGARWVLLAEPADCAEAARLFDALAAEVLPFPPSAERLGERVRAALRARPADRLSDRRQRDALSQRFSRWFSDLELPDLLRALDPRLSGVPLLVRGERGTGRALLAQYVHAFGGSAGGAFAFVPCAEAGSAEELLGLLRLVGEGPADHQGLTICLEDADRLENAVQQELRRWIEFGPPGGAVRASRLRWMATVGDDQDGALAPGLITELAQALAGVSVRIPPLRERSEAIERFARETARSWSAAHREPAPELAIDALEALSEYPWPGNQRELEAVVVRTLAAGARSPLRAEALRFDEVRPPGAHDALEAFGEPQSDPFAAERTADERGSDLAAATPRARASLLSGAAPRGGLPSESDALPTARAEAAGADRGVPAELDRLARALGHELRNPLVAIRTFSELLPERYEDPEFRERFRAAVSDDVGRLEEVAELLTRFATPVDAEPGPVDLTALLEELLDARRAEIRSRRLLVLKELESEQPAARGRGEVLRMIFEAVVDRALAWVPDRGDLYVASRRHAKGPRGEPCLRVLLRFPRPGRAAGVEGQAARHVSESDASLGLLLAELRLRAEGGSLTTSGLDADETVLVVDLPAF